jgi:hypothetical protein
MSVKSFLGGVAIGIGSATLVIAALTKFSDQGQELIHSARKLAQDVDLLPVSSEIVGDYVQLNDRAGGMNVGYPEAHVSDPRKMITYARVELFDIYPGSEHTQSAAVINSASNAATATVATQVRNDGRNSAFKAHVIADVVDRPSAASAPQPASSAAKNQ